MIRLPERVFSYGLLRHDALDEPGAVTQREEVDLAARAAVVQPSFDGDLFAFVLADVFYIDVSHRSIFSRAIRARVSISFAEPRSSMSNINGPS